MRVALILDRLALLPWLSNVSLQTDEPAAHGTLCCSTVTASLQTNGGHSMTKRIERAGALILICVGAIVVLLLGWMTFVGPERSKASHVDTQIAQQQDQLTAAQQLLATASKAEMSLVRLR